MGDRHYFVPGFLSVLLHVILIGGAALWAVVEGCVLKKKPIEIVPFTVAVDFAGEPDVPEPEVKEPEAREEPKKDDIPAVVPDKPKPRPKPEPKPKPKPEPKPKPKPKPEMKKGTRVENKVKLPQPKFKPEERQKLTDEEIRRALSNGAVIGPTTSIPKDEVSRNMSILKRELTKAWLKPGKEDEGWRPASVQFSLGAGGRISSPVLVTSSGNAKFDDSVLNAVKAVLRVDGLSPQFIKAYPELVIDFSFKD